MSERTVTIPLDEYLALQSYKKMASDNKDTVYVEKIHDTEFGSVKKWEVYSKNEYIKEINAELSPKYISREDYEAIREVNTELQLQVEEHKYDIRYRPLFYFFLFLWFFYAIAENIELIFK